MKHISVFLFLFLQFVYVDRGLSDSELLDKLYTDANYTSSLEKYKTSEHLDLLNECAVDLCGQPASLEKNQIIDELLEESSLSLADDPFIGFKRVESTIKATFDSIHQADKAFIESFKDKFKNGSVALNLPQQEYDSFYYYFGFFHFLRAYIFYDSSKKAGERFTLVQQPRRYGTLMVPLSSVSRELKVALEDYLNENIKLLNQSDTDQSIEYPQFFDRPERCDDFCRKIVDIIFSPKNITPIIEKFESANSEVVKTNKTTQCIGRFRKVYKNIVAIKHFYANTDETYFNQFVEDGKDQYIRNVFGEYSDRDKMLLSSFMDNYIRVFSPMYFQSFEDSDEEKITFFILKSFEDLVAWSDYQTGANAGEVYALFDRLLRVFYRYFDFSTDSTGDIVSLRRTHNNLCVDRDVLYNISATGDRTSQIENPGFDDVSISIDLRRYFFYDQKGFGMGDDAPYSRQEIWEPSDPDYGYHILVSMFSLVDESVGKATFAHELTHVFANLLEHDDNQLIGEISKEIYNKFSDVRQCVNNFYIKRTFQYSNEDMADIFSFMASRDESALRFCRRLGASSDDTLYSDLEILNSDAYDPHSATLLRLIREAQHKRVEMPTSCQKVMDSYRDELNFNLCF